MNYKKIISIFAMLASFSSFAHNDDAYHHRSSDLAANSKWMKAVNNDVKIRNLSIPGTHGSAALFGGSIVKNQTLSITQQLNAGIRFLDIRLRHINDVFAIHHGGVYQKQMFGDVLADARKFLNSNSSEFIFIRVKEEHNASSNTRSFEDTFNSYLNKNSDIIWLPNSRTDNPKIAEVRGKIVFLQNFAPKKYGWVGLDYHNTFNIQDEYHLASNWSLYSKWEKVKHQLNQANLNQSGYVNFLSGSGGSFPYFVASGHSSPGSAAPRLLTGLTTPGWKFRYPDFPRVSCFIRICSIAFEGTNTLTKNYINNNSDIKYVGIVASDFPGKGLIDAIISVNKRSGFLEDECFLGSFRVTMCIDSLTGEIYTKDTFPVGTLQ